MIFSSHFLRSREDYSVVNRFESHGGGWGYSGHSVEAIRFMADMDVLLGGFGLFGGRGEYLGKIKGRKNNADIHSQSRMGGEGRKCTFFTLSKSIITNQ